MRRRLRASLNLLACAAPALVAPVANAQEAPPKAVICVTCHGPAGHSAQALVPSLAGQSARYLYLELSDFQAGRRRNEQMSPIATGLSRDEIHALADYFAAQTPMSNGFTPDPAKARLGKAKADEVLCTMCHLGGFAGQNEIPRVAGQQVGYVVKQLEDFRARRRTNDAGTMTPVAKSLSDADIESLAQYICSL